jgi:hypothetical protein
MNKHARNSQYFATTKECRRRINQFFTNTLPEIAGSLSSTINDNFHMRSLFLKRVNTDLTIPKKDLQT